MEEEEESLSPESQNSSPDDSLENTPDRGLGPEAGFMQVPSNDDDHYPPRQCEVLGAHNRPRQLSLTPINAWQGLERGDFEVLQRGKSAPPNFSIPSSGHFDLDLDLLASQKVPEIVVTEPDSLDHRNQIWQSTEWDSMAIESTPYDMAAENNLLGSALDRDTQPVPLHSYGYKWTGPLYFNMKY